MNSVCRQTQGGDKNNCNQGSGYQSGGVDLSNCVEGAVDRFCYQQTVKEGNRTSSFFGAGGTWRCGAGGTWRLQAGRHLALAALGAGGTWRLQAGRHLALAALGVCRQAGTWRWRHLAFAGSLDLWGNTAKIDCHDGP